MKKTNGVGIVWWIVQKRVWGVLLPYWETMYHFSNLEDAKERIRSIKASENITEEVVYEE